MKKRTLSLIVLSIILLLIITACGQQNSASEKNEETQVKITKVKNGLDQLLSSSQNLKTAIDQSDKKKVKTIGPKLEKEWSSFEDQIKPKNPKNYEEVETYLDPTIAGTKVKSIDKKALMPLVDHLIKAVEDLSGKIGEK